MPFPGEETARIRFFFFLLHGKSGKLVRCYLVFSLVDKPVIYPLPPPALLPYNAPMTKPRRPRRLKTLPSRQ